MVKKFEVLQELPKCDTDMQWANAVGKTVWIDLLDAGLPINLEFVKNKTKTQSLWSAVKWSTIQRGMHVLYPPFY